METLINECTQKKLASSNFFILVYVSDFFMGVPRVFPAVIHRGWQSACLILLSATIKREMRRRSGIEPVIGHLKHDGHLERNHLAGPEGDAINAILSAVGQNMRLLARWLRLLCLCLLACLVNQNRKPEASI